MSREGAEFVPNPPFFPIQSEDPMKYTRSIIATVVLSVASVTAQVASHAPTMAQPKAANAPAVNPAPSASPTRIVARVNGTSLTERDLVREMYSIFPYAKQHNGGFPKEMEPQIRRGALQMIEFEELVYQEAKRRKMTVSAERMTQAMAQFRKQFHNEKEFQAYLRQEQHGSTEELRSMIRRSLLIDAFLKSEITNKSVITLAAAREFYTKNPQRFSVPESFEFQSISVIPPDNANPEQRKEARKRADEALKQAKATKSYQEFGLLAEKISDDVYHVNMGDHKAVSRAELPPAIVKAALAMKPGEVSDLIQVDSAFTIFRLNKHNLTHKKTLAEVQKPLREDMQKQKEDKLRTELNKSLRKNAQVEEL
jgi:peptidyl-prolyl cis-trans isomerase SurA